MLKENNLRQTRIIKAFSLLEISLVILVTAILIASITQGSKLIRSSKLSNAQTLTASSPVSSTDGLTLWLETTMPESLQTTATIPNFKPENNDEIKLWKDRNNQSIAKLDVSQSSIGSHPQYIRYGINDLPVLLFDGTNDWLQKSDIEYRKIGNSNEITIFIVQRHLSTNSAPVWWSANGNALRMGVTSFENNNIRFDFGTCCTEGVGRLSGTVPANYSGFPTILMSSRHNDNTGLIRLNGANLSSSTLTSTMNNGTPQALMIGRITGVTDYHFRGQLGEVIIFNRGLTIDEMTEIEKYLSKKWGIRIP